MRKKEQSKNTCVIVCVSVRVRLYNDVVKLLLWIRHKMLP